MLWFSFCDMQQILMKIGSLQNFIFVCSKPPIRSLSPSLQPHFRQLSSGCSPGCLAPRCQSGPGVPFYLSPLWWGMSDLQEVAKISHPTCTGGLHFLQPPSPPPLMAERHADCRLPGMELFKCAALLMSLSYCFGWTLIMNYEQLLREWGGIVIREHACHAERPESNHVWQQNPSGCHSVADLALWCPHGGEVRKMMSFLFFENITKSV